MFFGYFQERPDKVIVTFSFQTRTEAINRAEAWKQPYLAEPLFYHIPLPHTYTKCKGRRMNKPNAHPAKIRYRYNMDKEARLQTAHGVWGGINPQGEIEMNFYHESDSLPAFSEQLVAPDGSIGHEMVPGEDDVRDVTRCIHSRILLNYHTARAVLDWLEDRVAALEEEGASGMYEADLDIEQ